MVYIFFFDDAKIGSYKTVAKYFLFFRLQMYGQDFDFETKQKKPRIICPKLFFISKIPSTSGRSGGAIILLHHKLLATTDVDTLRELTICQHTAVVLVTSEIVDRLIIGCLGVKLADALRT